MSSETKQKLINLGRVVLSAGLLVWVIGFVGPTQLAHAFRNADWRLYAAGLLLSSTGIIIRAYRWWILLDAVHVRVSFWRLVYLYYVGAFYNMFLPTGFGGDVMRVLEFGEGATSQQAAGTVLVDRLTGAVMLFALALPALPFAVGRLPNWMIAITALLSLLSLAGGVLLVEGRVLRWLTQHFPRSLSLASDAWLGRTYAVITACGVRAVLGASAVSIVYNLVHITAMMLLGAALGLHAPFTAYFVFTPIAAMALLIPITVGGLGVREWLFVTLFNQISITSEKATALSLGTYSLDLLDGVIGGVVYLVVNALGLQPKARGS